MCYHDAARIERDACPGVSLSLIGGSQRSRTVFESLKQWYLALSPRRRTAYGVLISIIVATIPCYCMGGWALVQGFPKPNVPPALVETATPVLEPTPTQQPVPTVEPTPTQEPTLTLEFTPTQSPTATETPTVLPTETETPVPTETATVTPEPTETPTWTPVPTETPTPALTATSTSTPVISGTLSPPPELDLTPSSGPPGTEISISGRHFRPYQQYLLYWDAPETPIGVVLADDIGEIYQVVFTVPLTASVQVHQVMISLDGIVVARVPFTVTSADANGQDRQ